MKGLENPYDQLGSRVLTASGLNMQAVFPVDALPHALRQSLAGFLDDDADTGSLLLLGNGGADFWRALPPDSWVHPDPLDHRSQQVAIAYLEQAYPGRRYRVLYPSSLAVGLQQLGRLAGWHGDSPLKLGINPVFGLWYAYRALMWVEGALPVTTSPVFDSPCGQCVSRECIQHCPADALSDSSRYLQRCVDYRLAAESACQSNCLARLHCPVAPEQRYCAEQIRYHYAQSYETLVRWRQ
ncbi:hypothetical protein [Ketobacter sp.]|uniref:hypothetical protein n=1 Tax=Ketobacter sp. TaxID=2083498 RepID=UPI000F22A054|nr:hypothetical protein [Ketobacter sp.]RLT94475.1 MAG: hypothetical protein D9N14_16625 [Ketobacter sp.]